MDITNARAAINQAIQNSGGLFIIYTNNQGTTSFRVIAPLQWVNDSVFRAYCYTKQQELSFKLSNIQRFQLFDSVEEALQYQNSLVPSEDSPIEAYPIPSRPANRLGTSGSQNKFTSMVSQVKTSDEWSRLLQYYAECLSREFRQQYILKSSGLMAYTSLSDELSPFMLGKTKLSIKAGDRFNPNPIFRFIAEHAREFDRKLCLGYPFLVIDKDKIAPLIYAPLEISVNENEFSLQSEGYEVSYAAFKSIEMTDEEIEAFLEECDQVSSQDRSQALSSLKTLILSKITDIYQTELPRVKNRTTPSTIYDVPAFFWVGSNLATTGLIRELKELAAASYWQDSPSSLKQMLSIVPQHEYPTVTKGNEDKDIYVTPINRQQLRALHSVRAEPVVVVTGPPGTGKSQLVLNLLADAVLRGDKVLFASRNNRAVDVVMNRLQNEIKFQGAVRTGNQSNRRNAVSQMRDALNKAAIKSGRTSPSSEEITNDYFNTRKQVAEAQEKLEKIRILKGLFDSYKQEREQYLSFLPEELSQIEHLPPTYQTTEAQNLLHQLSDFLEQTLKLKEEQTKIETQLSNVVQIGNASFPLIQECYRIEDQFGDFGDGFLHNRGTKTAHSLFEHIQNWLDFIELVESEARAIALADRIKHLNKELSHHQSLIPAELDGQEKSIAAQFSEQQIIAQINECQILEQWFQDLSTKALPFSERLINFISFGAIFRKKIKLLFSIYEQFRLPIQVHRKPTAESSIQRTQGLRHLLISAKLYQERAQAIVDSNALLESIQQLRSALPIALQNDMGKMQQYEFDNSSLRAELKKLRQQAAEHKRQIDELVAHINRKIDENEDGIRMLRDFKKETKDRFPQLWHLETPIEIEALIGHITTWRNIVCFWIADYGYQHTSRELEKLPSEEQAQNHLKQMEAKMLTISGQILRTKWIEQAQKLDNEIYQKVSDYIAAVEKTSGGEESNENYIAYKAKEKENFIAASQMFPIWATTNLTARTNFPLKSGLFDLVILDEASQCDFASALPLLFRGKKIVIIGDPNQLRHVATLSKDADRELSQKYGVGLDAFSYNSYSLFDVALRSCGSHPGVLLLNEHYRSDSRIIGFSNQEFYDNKLIIRTDLSQRNIPKTFLNQFGGIFWLHTNGEVMYPSNGSLYNGSEIDFIQLVLPQLMEALDRHGLGKASIGIVTPFRAQEEKIKNQVIAQFGLDERITVGTAHKFQGDEKDFMIFSTVVGEGTKDGTINWLENTRNLLNVAVTRARICLLVVGDFNFCMELDDGHCFRRLAEYVLQQPSRVIQTIDQFPLFSQYKVDVIGYITDPHNPEHNRTTLRRFIASCVDYVWWTDPYFNDRLFDLWWDVFQDPNVSLQDIRLLTAKECVSPSPDGKKPQLSWERYQLIQAQLSKRGINFNLRLLPRRQLPHDRLLYTPGRSINMPPFAGAYGEHRHVSEYTRSNTNRELFLEYWEKAAAE